MSKSTAKNTKVVDAFLTAEKLDSNEKQMLALFEELSSLNATPVVEKKRYPTRAEKFADLSHVTGGMKITLLVTENPKRGKSAQRFSCYKNGMTVEQALATDLILPDLRWDVAHGFISIK